MHVSLDLRAAAKPDEISGEHGIHALLGDDLPVNPALQPPGSLELELFPALATRTVCRNTLVKGRNMEAVEGYAALLNRARPMFVESKGYSHMGASMAQLSKENMPTHEEIRDWTLRVCELMPGYELVNERVESRVTLLSRIGRNTAIPGLERNIVPAPSIANGQSG